MEKNVSFYSYMTANHLKDDTPAGDLARDMKSDPGFPKGTMKYERIRDHLESCAACSDCFDTFEECWNEYALWKEADDE